MSSNSYAAKVPMTDDEIKRRQPVCDDFVSFRAGVRAAERAYNVGDLVRQVNHCMDEWDNACNEIQRLLDSIYELRAECNEQARLNGMGAERELALRAEVERLQRAIEAGKNTP